jgi:hypothetical protein
MGLLSFAASSLLTLVLASALSVYVAGQVEHAWGKEGSFQALCILSAVAVVLLLIGFGIAAAFLRRLPRPAKGAILGAASAGVFIVTLAAATIFGADPAESWLLILLLPLLGGLSPLLGSRAPAK